jgi:thioesterase domain-containing protein
VNAPLEALRATLRNEMPVTQYLGIEPASYHGGVLTLRAPLAANVNHKGTAFGGSLNAIATLAGWGVVWLALRERGLRGEVVIQDSSVRYLRPVTGDFVARSGPPEPEALSQLVALVRRRGRGRIGLHAEVEDPGGVAVRFAGRYVVQAPTDRDG